MFIQVKLLLLSLNYYRLKLYYIKCAYSTSYRTREMFQMTQSVEKQR